ncbi:MAG: VOC family protein [Candidatus Bathyarchaeota archaeon]|nr:VOC family protein [Candidatus Termiticorpusculum sp.]
MKYLGVLISVKDIEVSKRFYKEVLGLKVESDLGANVTLTGGIALQTLDTWKGFIQKSEDNILFGNNAGELCFETRDIDSFCNLLSQRGDICYVHLLYEHPWGQRAIRFYDPDRHIIEVGEDMGVVVKRFISSGLSVAETAARMGVPTVYVEQYIL